MRSVLITILIIAALFPSLNIHAQEAKNSEPVADAKPLTLEDVLERYYKAIGGIFVWQTVNTMVIEGVILSQGTEIPTTAEYMRPDKCRVEYVVKGIEVVQAFDGETAWQQNPLSANPAPERLSKGRTDYLSDRCDIEGPLVGYQKKNLRVKLLGKGAIGESEVYKVGITYPSGNTQTYYLDGKTFLPVRADGTYTIEGQTTSMTTTFGDYRSVGKLVLPYSIEIDRKGQGPTEELRINKISIDKPVDPTIFTMP